MRSKKDIFVDEFNKLSETEKIQLYNTYAEWNGSRTYLHFEEDMINSVFSEKTPYEILKSIHDTFDPNEEWCYFDDFDGKLCTMKGEFIVEDIELRLNEIYESGGFGVLHKEDLDDIYREECQAVLEEAYPEVDSDILFDYLYYNKLWDEKALVSENITKFGKYWKELEENGKQ